MAARANLILPALLLLAPLFFAGCEGCNPVMEGVYKVEILNPSAGAQLVAGQEAFLQGRAYFMGDVGEIRYSWSSSIQGELGEDLGLIVDNLGIGPHQLTFTAQALDPVSGATLGDEVSVAVDITVTAPPLDDTAPLLIH